MLDFSQMDSGMLAGFILATIAALLAGAYYIFALIVRKLAERNLFWTFVQEGRAKAIMRNGRFAFCVMSFSGHMFKADAVHPPANMVEQWDIVTRPPETSGRTYWPLLNNIRWIGLPPFSTVHMYRFSWTSLEEESVGADALQKKYKYTDEPIDYVLTQEDVYVTKIEGAECSDNIPLDVVILVGGQVVNPYRSLFGVERWLEATLNRVDSKMRDFVGDRNYVQIRKIADSSEAGGAHELTEYFNEVIKYAEEHWGFKIKFIRILSFSPGSTLAETFITATTRVYVETQEAEANVQKGRGLAARDKAHFEALATIPGGVEMFKWQRIGESGLTTYVEGGNVKATIPVGGQPGLGRAAEERAPDHSPPT